MKADQFKLKLIDSSIGNSLSLALSLIFPFAVTSLYGTKLLGDYTFNLSIISLLIYIASLGLHNGLMYFIPRTGNKYILSTFIINLGLSLLLMGVCFFIFDDPYMKRMLPLLWFMSVETLFKSLFQSKQHIKEFFYVNLLANQGVKLLAAVVLALWIAPTYNNLIIATYIGAFVSLIAYYFLNKGMFKGIHFSWTIIKYSLPLTVSSVLFLTMMNADKIIIGNLMSATDVAIYTVAASIGMFPSLFLNILNTVFPPVISSMYHEGKIKELRHYYLTSVKYLTLVSFITVLVIFIFRRPIMNLYGPEYLKGQMALVFICVGQMVNAAVGSVWYMIMMTGHTKWNMYGEMSTFFVNIALNFLLIPHFGINGAAFATMVSTAYSNILGYFLVRGIFKSSVMS